MKKITIGKKGFSLIELLATILLISLVLGGGITIVTNTIKKSEEKSQVLALNNIKKTANTYVEEYANDIAWIDDKDNNNNKFSCVSIESLINKGYISNKDISSKDFKNQADKMNYVSKKQKTQIQDVFNSKAKVEIEEAEKLAREAQEKARLEAEKADQKAKLKAEK